VTLCIDILPCLMLSSYFVYKIQISIMRSWSFLFHISLLAYFDSRRRDSPREWWCSASSHSHSFIPSRMEFPSANIYTSRWNVDYDGCKLMRWRQDEDCILISKWRRGSVQIREEEMKGKEGVLCLSAKESAKISSLSSFSQSQQTPSLFLSYRQLCRNLTLEAS